MMMENQGQSWQGVPAVRMDGLAEYFAAEDVSEAKGEPHTIEDLDLICQRIDTIIGRNALNGGQ